MRFVVSRLFLILLIAAVACCQFGTKALPAVSCQSLLSRGAKPSSGVYWIKPKGAMQSFQGYCDMDTFGGGWLMCFTTNLHVHVSREVNSTVPYASNGYRSDCRNFPFNHVMLEPCINPSALQACPVVALAYDCCAHRYVDHSAKISQHDKYTSVWFQFNGFGTIKASATGFSGRLNSTVARFDRSVVRSLVAATCSRTDRNCSSTLGPTWTPHGGANIETWECRQAKAKWGTGNYVQADVLQVPLTDACSTLLPHSEHPSSFADVERFISCLYAITKLTRMSALPITAISSCFPAS